MDQMKQGQFEWAAPRAPHDPNPVVLDREATEGVIALMARAVIAVGRAVHEADDER